MLKRENKSDDRDSDEVEKSPRRDRPDDIAPTEELIDDIPADSAHGEDANEDRLTVPAMRADPVQDESWMPAWWQFGAGLVAFGRVGLGLAWLGGAIGVVLIIAPLWPV